MNKENNKNKGLLALLIVLIIACGAVITIILMQDNTKKDEKTLAYTDLINQVSEKNVSKVEMTTGSTTIKVTLKKEIDEKCNIVDGGVELKEDIAEEEKSKEARYDSKNRQTVYVCEC